MTVAWRRHHGRSPLLLSAVCISRSRRLVRFLLRRIEVIHLYMLTSSPASAAAVHTVQLFDDAKSRTDALVGFVRQGIEAGDQVLVVATREHWQSVAARLLRRGLQLDADIASYRLTVCDASDTLDLFYTNHWALDRDLFEQTVADRRQRPRPAAPRLRIYGEMVDLLAGRGDFANALRLEEWWNDLLRVEPAD